MTTNTIRLSHQLRRHFIDYFVNKCGHEYVKYSSILPQNDNTIEFVNAGMNQFKNIFLSNNDDNCTKSTLKRACNYQKCIRVGGKMCDLNSVGKDFRHHSFFEMLGNWSFGDYGKEEACSWAWDYLTKELELDTKRIFVTYYGDGTNEMNNSSDIETRDIWENLGVESQRIIENTSGDNFWEMGPRGPCGKSTEIYYTMDPCEAKLTSHDINNSLEIWNIVFINLERLDNGKIVKLGKSFIDTGMGLERITSCDPYSGSLTKPIDINYRILADHSRMITICLADGLMPGRRGAANKLRQMIKKSFWLASEEFKSERSKYLLFDLVDGVVETLKHAYPELESKVSNIRRILNHEYKRIRSV